MAFLTRNGLRLAQLEQNEISNPRCDTCCEICMDSSAQ